MISATELFGAVTVLVFLFLLYVKWSQNYWSRRNVPYIKPTSVFGNIENPFNQKRGVNIELKRSYDELKKRGHKHGGVYFFTQPIYVPVDFDLIKTILIKDFQHFIDRGFSAINEKKDPLTAHLVNLEGEKWRNMRIKLTPTFTSGKMKMMFPTLVDCGVPMIGHIDKLSKNCENLDIKEILACFTTDIIGSCAFGLECNSFRDPNAEFRSYGCKIVSPDLRNRIVQFMIFFFPSLTKYAPFKLLNPDAETFFINAVRNVIEYRKLNNIKRNDFIQIFIEMEQKAKADKVKCLTLEEIAAQSFLFFVAGFETSSATMTFCLHELAFNLDIQNKLRKEIRETLKKNSGVLTYDAVMEMKYLDQVIRETLRKYPVAPFLNRECGLDYKVPGTDVTLEKGTKVFISTFGIQRDEEFYPDPDKFDPERFTEENKAKRPAFSFLPFGEGPRNCIGLRFALMQAKTGISMLLNNFKITPAETEKYNVEFNPHSAALAKKGPIMLKAETLSDKI